MKRQAFIQVASVFILVLLLFSCHTKNKEQEKEVRMVTDMAGRRVEIPVELKTAFIDRHSVQLIYAFGAVDPVNRVFNYNESEKKYLKASFYEGKPYLISDQVEEIVKLKPDVILYSRLLTPDEIESANRLQGLTGIPVLLMDVDFDRYIQVLDFLGDIFHKTEKAGELKDFIRTYVDPIIQKAKSIPDHKKKRIYYAEGMKGLNTDPAGSIHSLLIDKTGGLNVANANILEGKGLTEVSLEQIYDWNPEIVLVWSGNFDAMDAYKYIKTSSAWAKLPAVRQNKVFQVPWRPFGWIDRPPGINRLIGLVWLAHLLYPEMYPLDLLSITQYYFSSFYHYRMSDEEVLEILDSQPDF